MKTFKTIFATIAVLLYSISASAHHFEADGIYYNIDDIFDLTVGVTFKGTYDDIGDYEGDVIIPESVTYNGNTYSVRFIYQSAFYNCKLTSIRIPGSVTSINHCAFEGCTLTSVTLPNSVKNLEAKAFYNCKLTSISIPESVTYISSSVFEGCTNLSTVTLPGNLTIFGEKVFLGCNSLTSVIISNGVENIPAYTFYGCSNLTSVAIPESVTDIGENAFLGCSKLHEIDIPNSVTSIGDGTFINCSGLTSVTIPEGVTDIASCVFRFCSSLTSVTIPESVTSIGENAFESCSSLTSVTIPESVTNIGSSAFYDCRSLRSIAIPESVTNIGDAAFYGCESMRDVYAHSLVSWLNIEFGGSYANPLHCASRFYINNSIVQGNLEIPSAITSLKPYALVNLDKLESITFSNTSGLKDIGDYAFEGCDGLISIDIPEGVAEIGSGAFSDCSSLTSIDIPEGVVDIGTGAFSYCRSLTSVIIPKGVTKIRNNTFDSCNSLTSVTIPEGVTDIGQNAFFGCYKLSSIIIPSSVTTIYNKAFGSWIDGADGLTTIICQAKNPPFIYSNTFRNQESCKLYVPEEALNDYQNDPEWGAFSNINAIIETIASGTCGDGLAWKFTSEDELIIEGTGNMDDFLSQRPWDDYIASVKKITIAEGVTSIGGQSFKGCSSLESLNISSSVTSIGHAAFAATPLETIEISASVTSIKGNPFVSCPLLKSIIVDGENTVFDSREDCNAIIEKSTNSLISGCSTTVIPNDVITICDDAFAGSSIENLTIPSSVQNIGKRAFKECEELASVVLGENVEIIGTGAFCGCNKLAEMKVEALIPPVVEDVSAFNDSEGERLSISLLVPNAVLETYRETDIWSDFMSIESYDVVVINDAQGSFSARSGNYEQITYTRTLNNTKWNALYLPFEIPVTAEFLEDYEVAYINAMHSYDEDDNGEIDRLSQEIVKIKNGTLHANHPYLIRAKTEEAKQMNITVENAKLYKAESVTLDCSSVYTKFEITGIYEKMTSAQLAGCYALSGGIWNPVADGASLNPFRLYMRITERGGSPYKVSSAALARIGIHVKGEETATSIEEMEADKQGTLAIYDLTGKRVLRPTKGQIYIVNGKKRVY